SLPTTGTARLRSRRAAVGFSDIVLDGEPIPDAAIAPDGADAVLGRIDPAACELEFTALKTGGEDGFEVHLGPDSPQSRLTVNFGTWQNKSTVVARSDDGIGCDEH